MSEVVTNNLELWTSALFTKSSGGRGGNGRQEAYGIKKLRELILELAVRGKLVPQDPNDEPASALLERIAEQRDRLAKEGKIKKPKELPEVGDDERPFPLPNGWEYVRLNELGEWGAGATPLRSRHDYYGGDIPWFKSGELVDDYVSECEERVTERALKETSLRYNKPGDVLIAMYGATIGKTSILNVAATTNQAVCACTPFSGFKNIFLLTLLKAYKSRFVDQGAGGAQPNISREKIVATVIALPPTAEQHRIVSKVEELMDLCDRLEQQQTDSLEAHQALVETLLGTLTRVASPQEFSEAWIRIADHFETLFTTEHSIDQLKQVVLQLAVMGKLVPQDPNDEPASDLLGKIAREKEQLITEGRIKRGTPLPRVPVQEQSFGIPGSWVWVRLGTALTKITDGTHHSPPNGEAGKFLYISAKNIKDHGVILSNATYVSKEIHEEIYSRCDPELGDVLYIKDGATTGIATINNLQQPFSMLSSVALLKCPQGLLNTYLLLSLRSPYFYSEMRAGMTGVAITRVTLKKLSEAFISLPPFAEQRRIVAKVDELMALCDALKARIADAQTTKIHLADAIVEQAIA